MANYENAPVLSKIKIGEQYYWLKDADARALLTSVEGRVAAIEDDYLVAADKTELEGKITSETNTRISEDTRILDEAKAYTNQEIGKIKTINYEIVSTLPEAGADYDFDVCKTVYMIKEGSGKTGDYFKEYICVKDGATYKWELIGDTRIDLSNYYTKTETDDAIAAGVDEAEGYADELNTAMDARVGAIETKPAMDITSKQISDWDGEVGAKAAVQAEVTRATGKEGELATAISDEAARATGVEGGLRTDVDKNTGDIAAMDTAYKAADTALGNRITAIENQEAGWNDKYTKAETNTLLDGKVDKVEGSSLMTEAEHTKLAGVEAGAQVNIIESIKVNDAVKTVTDKQVDLGNIATAENTVNDVTYTEGTHTLNRTKNDTSAAVHQFGDLADENLADLEVKGQTVDVSFDKHEVKVTEYGIKDATTATAAEISRTDYTPAGDVDVTLSGDTFNAITGVGTLATYQDGNVTGGKATVIDTSKFNGGAVATFTQGAKANLVYETSDSFVKEGIKARVGTSGDDLECLIFEDVTNKGTASVITNWTANGNDTFDGGAIASINSGFYTAGTDVSYTAPVFTQGTLPSMVEHTVSVASTGFTGTKETGLKVTGATYLKQELTESEATKTVTVTGTVTVADKAVTKKTL